MKRVVAPLLLALAELSSASASAAEASPDGAPGSADSALGNTPAPPPAPAATPQPKEPARTAGDLQSPEQVNTRYSAYSLPARQLSFKAGALGVGDGDLYAQVSVSYGLGARVQLNANLMHMGVGLFNLTAGWHFIDTRYFDLGARLGAWYGHGKWFWIANDVATQIVSKLDVIKIPFELTASSMPTRWLELDLGVQYTYAMLFGTSARERSIFTDNELGTTQFFVRPGVRIFITGNTALELFAKLPAYSAVNAESGSAKLPFERTWAMEVGLRSRLVRGLFGNIRLQYAPIADVLYGARLYPAFDIEIRP